MTYPVDQDAEMVSFRCSARVLVHGLELLSEIQGRSATKKGQESDIEQIKQNDRSLLFCIKPEVTRPDTGSKIRGVSLRLSAPEMKNRCGQLRQQPAALARHPEISSFRGDLEWGGAGRRCSGSWRAGFWNSSELRCDDLFIHV